eukprot:GDKH01021774.1.p1 GENE.GDKH01021774.1~~GDKH01021774.1.p1  ORF type:complete len:52 (-),score=1.09 GDKH01021774.1:300-455(-)
MQRRTGRQKVIEYIVNNLRYSHKFPKKLACLSMYCHILAKLTQAETAIELN